MKATQCEPTKWSTFAISKEDTKVPIYEFQCSSCKGITSVLVKKVGAPYRAQCDHCESKDVERTITGFSYHRTTSLPTDPRTNLLDKLASKKTFEETGLGITEEGRALMDAIKDNPQEPVTSV